MNMLKHTSTLLVAALFLFAACKKEEKKEENAPDPVYGSVEQDGNTTDLGTANAFVIDQGGNSEIFTYDFYVYSANLNVEFDYQIEENSITKSTSASGIGGAMVFFSVMNFEGDVSGATVSGGDIQTSFAANVDAYISYYTPNGAFLEADTLSATITSFDKNNINVELYLGTEDNQEATMQYNGPVSTQEYVL